MESVGGGMSSSMKDGPGISRVGAPICGLGGAILGGRCLVFFLRQRWRRLCGIFMSVVLVQGSSAS